jgi:hypothetical protein
MKYKYKGKEPRKVYDCTGKVIVVNEGDVFEMKSPVNLENIEEVKPLPKKKVETEDKENDMR